MSLSGTEKALSVWVDILEVRRWEATASAYVTFDVLG
jgi:hypothetical protein